jgi:limonene-1,2-epoxide hydrolase
MNDSEALVREFCEAWTRRDADEITNYFTPDGVYHNMPLAPLQGHEAIRGFLVGFLSGVSSAEFRILNLVADGNVVMTERVDVFQFGKVTGEFAVAGIFEIEDGKISAWRDYFDMAQVTSFLAQTQQGS